MLALVLMQPERKVAQLPPARKCQCPLGGPHKPNECGNAAVVRRRLLGSSRPEKGQRFWICASCFNHTMGCGGR